VKWLLDVLAEHAHLDLGHPTSRGIMGEAVLGAIPKPVVVEAIASSAAAVLLCHGTTASDSTSGAELAREIGHNAAATLLVLLQVDPDPDNEQAIPDVVTSS
jgi:hypothetical protein